MVRVERKKRIGLDPGIGGLEHRRSARVGAPGICLRINCSACSGELEQRKKKRQEPGKPRVQTRHLFGIILISNAQSRNRAGEWPAHRGIAGMRTGAERGRKERIGESAYQGISERSE